MYKMPVIVKNRTAQSLNGYAVKVVLDEAWEGWSLVGDGSDIFFVDNKSAPLYYWIEEFDKLNRKATIWVKVNISAHSSTAVYMIFGGTNPYSSYHSPDNVFLLFDDFETDRGWTYVETNASWNGTYDTAEYVSPTTSYKISYPSSTISSAGDYGAIYKDNISSNGYSKIKLSLYVKDSRATAASGYHFKQILVDDVVVWEEDVAYGGADWEEVELILNVGSTFKVMLRVYDKKGVWNFGVNVWWDNIVVRPYVDVEPAVELGEIVETNIYTMLSIIVDKDDDGTVDITLDTDEGTIISLHWDKSKGCGISKVGVSSDFKDSATINYTITNTTHYATIWLYNYETGHFIPTNTIAPCTNDTCTGSFTESYFYKKQGFKGDVFLPKDCDVGFFTKIYRVLLNGTEVDGVVDRVEYDVFKLPMATMTLKVGTEPALGDVVVVEMLTSPPAIYIEEGTCNDNGWPNCDPKYLPIFVGLVNDVKDNRNGTYDITAVSGALWLGKYSTEIKSWTKGHIVRRIGFNSDMFLRAFVDNDYDGFMLNSRVFCSSISCCSYTFDDSLSRTPPTTLNVGYVDPGTVVTYEPYIAIKNYNGSVKDLFMAIRKSIVNNQFLAIVPIFDGSTYKELMFVMDIRLKYNEDYNFQFKEDVNAVIWMGSSSGKLSGKRINHFTTTVEGIIYSEARDLNNNWYGYFNFSNHLVDYTSSRGAIRGAIFPEGDANEINKNNELDVEIQEFDGSMNYIGSKMGTSCYDNYEDPYCWNLAVHEVDSTSTQGETLRGMVLIFPNLTSSDLDSGTVYIKVKVSGKFKKRYMGILGNDDDVMIEEMAVVCSLDKNASNEIDDSTCDSYEQSMISNVLINASDYYIKAEVPFITTFSGDVYYNAPVLYRWNELSVVRYPGGDTINVQPAIPVVGDVALVVDENSISYSQFIKRVVYDMKRGMAEIYLVPYLRKNFNELISGKIVELYKGDGFYIFQK